MGRLTGVLGTAADLLLRALALQGLWLLGTLAGGVLLGWAPATMAAADAALRAERGQRITLRRAAQVWWAQFLRSQFTLGLPVLLLALGVGALAATGAPLAVRLPAGLAAVLLLAEILHIPALDLRYEVPATSVLGRATLLALAQAHTTLLLGAVLVLWGAVALSVPGLLPVLGIGVPLLISQHLVGRSLDRNEELLAPATQPPPDAPDRPRGRAAPARRSMPSQPPMRPAPTAPP